MTTLLSLLLLVSSSFALPSYVNIGDSSVSLSVIASVKTDGIKKLIEADRRHAQNLVARLSQANSGNPTNVPLSNFEGVTYTAKIGVGSPPHYYELIIDTGSSNTWVGATQKYVHTKTSTPTKDNVNVTYGSGNFFGKEYIDQVTIAPGAVIQKQSIGVASTSIGFQGYDGILGIGPVDLTTGTLSPDVQATIPTVTDNLFSQGTIKNDEIGISFEPSITGNETNGEMTLGGINPNKFTGNITYTPITKKFPSGAYWGIDQSIKYGKKQLLPHASGIVDTGTTLMLLATDAFQVYQQETGAVMDENTGLLRITPDQFSKLQSMYFTVENVVFELTANAQAWPRKLNSMLNGQPGFVYLMIGDVGVPSGKGFDFINGYTFLQRHYSVFDTKNRRVGLAKTPYTYAETN